MFKYIFCNVIVLLIVICANLITAQVDESEICEGKPQIITGDYVELCDYGKLAGATSSLKDRNDPLRYMPGRAFDGKINTAWVEGQKDDGIGEKIAFVIPPGKNIIRIFPGLGTTQYFSKNNRLKKAKLTIYFARDYFNNASYCKSKEYAATLSCCYGQDKIYEKIIEFIDKMEFQEFSIPSVIDHGSPPGGIKFRKVYAGVLEIVEVYHGSKWKDTCISEIQFE